MRHLTIESKPDLMSWDLAWLIAEALSSYDESQDLELFLRQMDSFLKAEEYHGRLVYGSGLGMKGKANR